MLRRYVGPPLLALAALFCAPSVGSAGILDIIWDLSGPQMVGAAIFCTIDVNDGSVYECRGVGYPLKKRKVDPNTQTTLPLPTVTFALEGGLYTSTGWNRENTNGIEFEFWNVKMAAIEPMLELRSKDGPGGFDFYYGAGLSFMAFHSDGPDRDTSFNKFGFKFLPVGVSKKGWFDAALTIRLFPNGFTPDEFGFGPEVSNIDRPSEVVYGAYIGFGF